MNLIHRTKKFHRYAFAKAHLFFAMLIGFVAEFGSDCRRRRFLLSLALAAVLVS